MRMRWCWQDGGEMKCQKKSGSVIMQHCTCKHYQNSIFTVCTRRLTSIQLSINKCRFHSVPCFFFDTCILREINGSGAKSISPPHPSQLIAFRVVFVFLYFNSRYVQRHLPPHLISAKINSLREILKSHTNNSCDKLLFLSVFTLYCTQRASQD